MAASSATVHSSKSAQIRARLDHPIIDSDGHCFELEAAFLENLLSIGGADLVDRFKGVFNETFMDPRWQSFSPAERAERRNLRPTWRGLPARNTRDLATAMLPGLLYERMGEMGLDYSVIYTTLGFGFFEIYEDDVRQASCRALNKLRADMFRPYSDRITPAAVIPMHTPGEAIEELEYCVRELGLKSAMVASYVKRPIKYVEKRFQGVGRWAYWLDSFGLDSEYDYDPFWSKCLELGISPTFHSVGYGWGARQSISNYVYNHIGSFAASAEIICKSILMGGVATRFPKLTFAFLEGGIPWARSLYCDLLGHWHKRNREALEAYNLDLVNRPQFAELAARYGGELAANRDAGAIVDAVWRRQMAGQDMTLIDEWAPSGITSPEQIRDIFVKQFYFGCEGDDPLNALAFKPQGTPYNIRLSALYGSDIGHWDVPDMSEVAEEAYEMVEEGLITPGDLREFVFVNAVKFWTSTNPKFFKGTAVERETDRLVADGFK